MSSKLQVGDRVVVRTSATPGHVRTPRYVQGKTGVIERVCGAFPNPEELAYGRNGLPRRTLYRVRFQQAHLWPDYRESGNDTLDVEIYEHWLRAAGD